MPERSPEGDPLDLIIVACLDPLESAWAELGERLAGGLERTIREALERHRAVVASIGLDDDPPREWDVRGERLLQYRRAVSSEVLEPIVQSLVGAGPSAVIEEALSGGLARAAAACRDLPVTVIAPWPDGALARRPTDGVPRRVGKVLARFMSAARKSGRDRELPLRGIAWRHLTRVVAPGQDEAAVGTLTAWAELTGGVEQACVAWGDTALPALVQAEIEDDAEGAAGAWSAVREAAGALDARLGALLGAESRSASAAGARSRLQASRGVLETELAVAGSFLTGSVDIGDAAPVFRRMARFTPAFGAWDEGVAARLRMYVSLLAIMSGATAVQRRLLWRFREHCLSRFEGLSQIADALESLVPDLTRRGEGKGLGRDLAELNDRVGALLGPGLSAVPDATAVDATIRDGSDAAVEALLAMIRQAPQLLVLHEEDATPPSGARPVETRTVALQDLARQSFDALRIERIRSSTAGLVEAIDQTRLDLSALPEVFSFAYDAALLELEEGEPGAEDRAVGLVTEALRSMAEGLRSEVRDLDAATVAAQATLAVEIGEGCVALLDRGAAGRVQTRLLAARSRFADSRAWVNRKWGPPVDRALRVVVLGWTLLRRRGSRLLSKALAIVGREPATQAASQREIQALADSDAVIEGLPLVYRRLFTLSPISDPALLTGRARELATASARWERWRSSDGIPLVVRGRPGDGVTSFLNVLGAQIEQTGTSVARISLAERVSDEAELARILTTQLGHASVDSLDDVATLLFDATPESPPGAVIIDDLEHLFLRVAKGTDLIERVLTLMAETEPRVFWIGGVTTSAWQLIAATQPTAVSQVEVLDLPPLTSEDVRAAVTVRHRRSGLPVRYEEPPAGRHLLRRRLRRMRDASGHRGLLEDDYFERLYRTSSGHLRLALYQWLQSADFDSGDGVLARSPAKPDFSVFDSLSLTQGFTLKAFLEHRTLTLEEHDRIFRIPRHESYQILESLSSRHLIQTIGQADGEDDASEIRVALRYRVRPLLIGAVTTHLRDRNIVH